MYACRAPSFEYSYVAPAGPWMSSVVQTRKYAILSGLSLRIASASAPLVSVGFVFDGLICASCRLFVRGISARATLLLNGPMTPSTALSAPNVWMFLAPCAGSCTPLTASSSTSASNVKPGTRCCSFACLTASCAPYCVGTPMDASAPDTGRSMPILIRLPAGALPPDVAAVPPCCCPEHALVNAEAAASVTQSARRNARTPWAKCALSDDLCIEWLLAKSNRREKTLKALSASRAGKPILASRSARCVHAVAVEEPPPRVSDHRRGESRRVRRKAVERSHALERTSARRRWPRRGRGRHLARGVRARHHRRAHESQRSRSPRSGQTLARSARSRMRTPPVAARNR